MAGIAPHPPQLQVGRAMAGGEVEDALAADPVAAAREVAAVEEAAPTGAAVAVAVDITTKSLTHL